MATNHSIEQICRLLESPDTAHKMKNEILDNLKYTKETWLTTGLVDYYFLAPSQNVQEILAELREFQAKVLIDKLSDGIKTAEHRLSALQLLLYLAYRELPWCHLIMDSPIITALLKFLKTDNDAVILMTSLIILVILLPSVPDSISLQIQTVFEIFGRLASYCYKKPASTSEAYIVHINVALYSLFNRLYGMYPCMFMAYLNKFCTLEENIHVFEEIIMPMIERVRLHPKLVKGMKETETSKSRWKDQETQDIVVNCSKFTLDLFEGSWEDCQPPLFTSPEKSTDKGQPGQSVRKANEETSRSCRDTVSTQSMHMLNIDPSYVGESPSVLIGLSTPPSSHRTTPAASFVEPISNPGGPLDTPEMTPRRQTPSHYEDGDKTPHTSVRNVLSSDGKKPGHFQTASNGLNSPITDDISSFNSKTSAFIVPNPSRSSTVRSLQFNSPEEERQDQDKKEAKTEVTSLQDSGKSEKHPVKLFAETKAVPVPVESLPHIINSLATPDSDILDKEVAEINEKDHFDESSSPSSSVTTMTSQTDVTAESVRQFMKKVNRIRFNSLTSNSSSDYDAVSISHILLLRSNRSRSCPPLKRQAFLNQSTAGSKGNTKKQTSAGEGSVMKDTNRPTTLFSRQKMGVDFGSDVTKSKKGLKNSTKKGDAIQYFPSDHIGNEMETLAQTTPIIFNPVIQYVFAPSKLTVCSHCHKQLVITPNHESAESTTLVTYKDNEVPFFNSIPPAELLDRHIKLGSDLHNKELTTLPLVAKDSTNWTHFGGTPPADEVNILKNQLLMVQNQLMYERHKRVNHDKRNRRLLRKITNMTSLEEQQKALSDQVRLHEETIQNLNVCVKLLEEEKRRLKQTKESDEYERFVQFSLAIKESKDLKASNVALKDLLLTQKEDYDKQQKTLENIQHKYLESEKELETSRERLSKVDSLKEKIFQLQKEVLLMQELYQKCQEKINFTKTLAGHKLEESYLIKSLHADVDALTKENRKKNNLLEAYQTRAAELETMLKAKDTTLQDIRRGFEESKHCHQEMLKAVEDRCQSLVHINQLLEAKYMDLMAQLDKATHKNRLDIKAKDDSMAVGQARSSSQQVLTNADTLNCERSSNLTTPVIQTDRVDTNSGATVIIAKEEVSLASSVFTEPDLTSLPQDGVWDSGAVSRSSYREESDVSINSLATGDSGL